MTFNNMGISNLMGIASEFSHIKSGSYKSLLNAYYSKVQGKEKLSKEDVSSLLSDNHDLSNEKEPLKKMITASDSLRVVALGLMETGKNSAFDKEKVEKVDEETGEKSFSEEYDLEKIKDSVSQFVSDYNEVIENSANTNSKKVMEKTLNMIDNTKIYKDKLEKIGISIGSDNKLTIDEEKFEESNMDIAKDLFNKENSFGQKTMGKALQIGNEAYKAQLTENLYNSMGDYDSSDYSSLLNMYL